MANALVVKPAVEFAPKLAIALKKLPNPGDQVRQRGLAAYLALACGDALGSTTEFLTPDEIQAKHGVHKNLIGGGWLQLKPGQITDDTEMNLYLGRAMVISQGFDLRMIAEQWVQWMRSKPVDMGATVRQGLRAYLTERVMEQPAADWMGGNGAAMRNLPVILATLGDERRLGAWSLQQAHVTHHHPVADQGLLFLAEMASSAILLGQRAPLKSISDKWAQQSKQWDYQNFKRSIDGYIVNTVKTVLYYLFNTKSLEDCLVGIANAGGDTDTNAAIAGMIAGPYYGMEEIPSRWLKRLDSKVLEEIHLQTEALWEIFYE